MADFSFPIPVELTKKGWDDKKGVFAKIFVPKTDVGAALKELEDKIKEKKFGKDYITAFPGKDPVEYLDFEKNNFDSLMALLERLLEEKRRFFDQVRDYSMDMWAEKNDRLFRRLLSGMD